MTLGSNLENIEFKNMGKAEFGPSVIVMFIHHEGLGRGFRFLM